MLGVGEIDAEGRIVAAIAFDPEEIDAAIEELDARYLAGEAAAHSHTWSVITQAYTALNHRKLPPAKADWVNRRPPARNNFRPRRHDRIHPCRDGT